MLIKYGTSLLTQKRNKVSFNNHNNFDLVRLFAALQVAICHSAGHFGYQNFAITLLGYFPGVPIFFFVSGFLIYSSYEKSKENQKPLINFYQKRFLRLYPALWFCFLLSVISVWQSGYFDSVKWYNGKFLAWCLAQVSFFQFYNLEFLRGYGVGVLNGSLWTIAVELQFYMLTPFLYYILTRSNKTVVFSLIFILILVNVLNSQLNYRDNILMKLFYNSFVPWIYMFILGALLYKNEIILNYIKKTPLFIFISMYVLSYFLTKDYGWGNAINPISYILLACMVTKFAFTAPNLSDSILNRNDLSYGIYIFHMPIVNYLIYSNISGGLGFFICLIATIIFSFISWFVVEKKSLSLKNNPLRNIQYVKKV